MADGWDQLNTAIQALNREIREVAPDATTADEGEAYIARVLTACLNDCFLGHLLTEDGFSRALPTRGAPNPDYRMQHALLESARSYQLAGCLNDSERVGVGLFTYGEGGSLEINQYLYINATNADSTGNFLIDISAEAEGANALTLQADACILLVRTLHRNQNGVPARLRLIGATAPTALALSGGSTTAALARAAQITIGSVHQFLSWSEQASAYPNQFRGQVDGMAQTVQGEPDTEYYLGYFELAENEILQATMPSGLDCYWSIHAYNHWCEYLPGASANDLNTQANHEGDIVMGIGPRLPVNTLNPIDTRGRHKGVLLCRVAGTTLHKPPETAVVNLDSCTNNH